MAAARSFRRLADSLPIGMTRLPSTPAADSKRWDVIIVGAGPAGLSAALVLGRCCRSVLVCDRGTPRSWASKAMHGFLSRDPISPDEFHGICVDELRRYENVALIRMEVAEIRPNAGGFTAASKEGQAHECRKVLIATGLFDELPKIDGVFAFFGISVFQCPYCDGWEARDRPVAVYGRGRRGYQMARALTAWTNDIALCTDGPSGLSSSQREALERNRIPVIETPISELIGRDGQLESIEFENGDVRPCGALFFDTPSKPQSNLALMAGCTFARDGGVRCGRYAESSVPGVFAAGNITRDVQLAIVAAAEGAKAAFGINLALTREDFGPD